MEAFDDPSVVHGYDDWYATPYGRVSERIHLATLTELLGDPAPGARLLDIGCATGRKGEHLVERGWSVVGCDPSAGFLATAAERMPVCRADGRALPFADGAFDAVAITFVLEFLDDPERLLREARRVTRGPIAVIALCGPSYLSARRWLAGLRGHPVFSQLRHRRAGEWSAVARAAGEAPVRVMKTMVLPPIAAGWMPRLERWLSRRDLFVGGMVGLELRIPRGPNLTTAAPPPSD